MIVNITATTSTSTTTTTKTQQNKKGNRNKTTDNISTRRIQNKTAIALDFSLVCHFLSIRRLLYIILYFYLYLYLYLYIYKYISFYLFIAVSNVIHEI